MQCFRPSWGICRVVCWNITRTSRMAAKRDAVANLESGLMEHSSRSAEELASKAVN
jgi:hypothetical protein